MKVFSTILIVAGVIMMVITGFNMITKEKVVDLGPVEVNREKSTPISWSPIVGLILIVSGVAIMLTGRKGS